MAGAGYDERLWVPWWWWPLAGVLAAVLAIEVWLGVFMELWLALLIALALTAGVLLWLSRVRVRLDGDTLYAGPAHLPLRHVAGLEALDRRGARRALGPEGDPSGFVVSRPWVGGALRIVLDDPRDPTPYWLVSTRRPTDLLQAVYDAARAGERTRSADADRPVPPDRRDRPDSLPG